jgi:hypothetical protein
MPNYAELVAEARRRVLLEVLALAPSKRANDAVIRAVVDRRVDVTDRALVRADMDYLAQHGLISVDKLVDGERVVWIATLTDSGAAVARGRAHVGVADPELC